MQLQLVKQYFQHERRDKITFSLNVYLENIKFNSHRHGQKTMLYIFYIFLLFTHLMNYKEIITNIVTFIFTKLFNNHLVTMANRCKQPAIYDNT